MGVGLSLVSVGEMPFLGGLCGRGGGGRGGGAVTTNNASLSSHPFLTSLTGFLQFYARFYYFISQNIVHLSFNVSFLVPPPNLTERAQVAKML